MWQMFWITLVSLVSNCLSSETLASNGTKQSTNQTFNRKERILDLSYLNPFYPNCACGVPNRKGRVVNGRDTAPNEFPWMAYITFEGNQLCGGALINDRYVLTAAHCISFPEFSQNKIKVTLGEYNRCTPDVSSVVFSVERAIANTQYDPRTFYFDAALLKLSMKVTFNDLIKPICLPDIRKTYSDEVGVVIGWGSEDSGVLQVPCVLQYASVPILSREECDDSDYFQSQITSTTLCAGFLNGGSDACQGDSGGPLMVRNDKRKYEIVGIVSSGSGCGSPGFPGLYTRVSKLINWIRDNTKDSSFCSR